MDEKTLSLDLLEKGTNLVRFLGEEKGEKLISSRLFDAICSLCESCYSLKAPSLAKTDAAALRKAATGDCGRVSMYLEMLCASMYISTAQKDSVLQTLDALKKVINI